MEEDDRMASEIHGLRDELTAIHAWVGDVVQVTEGCGKSVSEPTSALEGKCQSSLQIATEGDVDVRHRD